MVLQSGGVVRQSGTGQGERSDISESEGKLFMLDGNSECLANETQQPG